MKLNADQLLTAVAYSLCSDVPLLMWGGAGAGKSAISHQAAGYVHKSIEGGKSYLNRILDSSAGMNFNDLRLAHVDISEWGMLSQQRDPTWNDEVHTSTRPQWFPNENSPDFHVLFLDEPNRAEDETAINGTMQILAERALRHRKASKGFRIIGAANPPTDGYNTLELDVAAADRWCHVDYKPEVEHLVKNRRQHLDPCTVNLLEAQPDFLTGNQIDAEWRAYNLAVPSPRSWEMLSKLHAYVKWREEAGLSVDSEVLEAMVCGIVGHDAGTAWMNVYNSTLLPTVAGLINGDFDFEDLAESDASLIPSLTHQLLDTLTQADEDFFERTNSGFIFQWIFMLGEMRRDLCFPLVNWALNEACEVWQNEFIICEETHPLIVAMADWVN